MMYIPYECMNCTITDMDICKLCGLGKLDKDTPSRHDWITNGVNKDEHRPEKNHKRAYRFCSEGLK